MLDMLIQSYRLFFLFLYEHLGFALAILLTSIISTFLMKPIAKFIMKYVKREQAYQMILLPQVDAINASEMSGAEKHLALQRLYARYGYSPILATRKVLPLFVQLPFLMVTYWMLEGCAELEGVKFLCFSDLGAPDKLLPFGVNLLPFVMTGINLVAIFATPSFLKKDQIQALVVALLFLILLYPASSALMIYWTLNNFFTCLKALLEENYAGAKLLSTRLRYIFALTTIRAGLHNLFNLKPEVYATAAFVCALFAGYSYLLYSSLYGNASATGKLASNGMVAFFALSIFLQGLSVRGKIRWISLCVSAFAFLLQGVIIADKFFICSALFYGDHWKYLLWVLCGEACAFVALAFCIGKGGKKEAKAFSLKEFLCASFFILSIACHYLFSNAILGLDASAFLGIMSGLLLPYWILLVGFSFLFRKQLSIRTILRILFVFVVVFYSMPLIAEGNGILAPSNSCALQYLILFVLGSVLLFLWKKNALMVNFFLCLLSIFLIGNGVYSVAHNDALPEQGKSSAKQNLPHLHSHSILNKYNVFVLFYDGYPNSLILKALDVYDPSEMLKARGFTVYPRAYSATWSTLPSMATFYDVFSNAEYSVKDTMTGNNEFVRFLQREGYVASYILSPYSLSNTIMPLQGDFYYPNPKQSDVRMEKILLKNIRNGFLSQSADSFATGTLQDRQNAKRGILARTNEQPQFLYAHTDYPGHAAWNPKYKASWQEEIESFKARVVKAEKEINADLDSIKDREHSIIVIASDHGASLFSQVDPLSGMGLLDKYGIQLAVKWPSGYKPTMDLSFSGNVMLEVLICLTGDKSLAQYRRPGLTTTPGIDIVPKGIIENSIIQSGPDKGKNLFDTAKNELEIRRPGKTSGSFTTLP